MSFRQRLALFLIVTLAGIQALTAISAYSVVRGNLVQQGKIELAATASAFMRQLTVMSERVSDDVEVLSLDYALRKAVAEHDQDTLLSALRNHGNRIGATRMLLVGFDGKIAADTTHSQEVGAAFPFRDLLDDASAGNQGTALAVLDGGIYWIVVVPVRAPVTIAFIAACVPVDDALLEKLRQLSPVGQALALATPDRNGAWRVATKTRDFTPALPLASIAAPSSAQSEATAEQHGSDLVMVRRLATAQNSAPVLAILNYPLAEALGAYRAVIAPMLGVLAAALIVALAGAVLIARGVSMPLESLAAAARRIATGNYAALPPLGRRDEIGELSSALNGMVRSIADREMALKSAIGSLELARNEAVKASEAKSQFLSNMSHELRTPLNAIIGFSEMIHTQMLGALSPPRYIEYARHVYDSGRHLLSQVQEMLDLSDAESGNLELSREAVSPGALLAASTAALAEFAKAQGVLLTVTGDPEHWPEIDADAGKLGQSLTNLIHNAIKFTPAGGSVTVDGEIDGARLRLIVADTGIGIAAEDLPLVVRPFHRRKSAFDARHQGAGLGLPFAKTIVEMHGGAFRIDSTPGAGTTVTVEIPLAHPSTLEDAA